MKILFIFLLISIKISVEEKIDDSIHYYLSFTSDSANVLDADLSRINGEVAGDRVFGITTKNKERFLCRIPDVKKEERKVLSYEGPPPDELLETLLYKDKMCSYLIDVYWSYQVCHGRYITQYHDDNVHSVARTEYYLGNLHIDYANKKSAAEISNPPKRRIENEDYPYFSVSYTRGTNCDVTGKPRTTDVIYICVENVENKILSVTEVSSCHYEIVIMTGILCKHPAYQLTEQKNHEIKCWNQDGKDEESAKPVELQNLDSFHDSTFKREFTITNTEEKDDEDEEEKSVADAVDYEQYKNEQDGKHRGLYKLSGEKRFESKETLANNPHVVQHTVNSILSGNECIIGGQGWWKYEFCYGKQVIQFHEEPNGHRLDIVLGNFYDPIHKAWVQEAPSLRGPKKIGNHITQVHHLYSKGDICEETGAHRSVEVRLRCQHSEHSALAISMSLTEPKTCQYLLIIESERFCEPLQYVDDFGLIHLENIKKYDAESSENYKSQRKENVEDEEEEEEEEEQENRKGGEL